MTSDSGHTPDFVLDMIVKACLLKSTGPEWDFLPHIHLAGGW
jgi:hypothetical protein